MVEGECGGAEGRAAATYYIGQPHHVVPAPAPGKPSERDTHRTRQSSSLITNDSRKISGQRSNSPLGGAGGESGRICKTITPQL